MSDTSPNLDLPYLASNQAQKHVTLNESLRRLDILVQAAVKSKDLATPPAEPEDGDLYILPASTTGDWAGHAESTLAAFQDGGWMFVTPKPCWRCHVVDTGRGVVFDGTVWASETDLAPMTQFGINTSADSVNRLAVKSDAELLSHDDVTPSSGDARKVINKAGSGQVASVLFQTGYSARAELGLVGDDNFSLRVSPDGASFEDAIRFVGTTGAASFPNGVNHTVSGLPVHSILPTTGGDGVISVFRLDDSRVANPRTFTIDAISGADITVTVASTCTIYKGNFMSGVSMLRIWNTTKSPAEQAWVVDTPDTVTISVLDSASISGWSPGDTIQAGDPTGETPGRVMAVDISPMMENLFGDQ